MAEIAAKTDRIKQLCEAYGVAVRAGLITPCLQDENDIRKLMGLQPAPPDVEADWEKSQGVRKPVTIQRIKELVEDEDALSGEDEQPNQEAEDDEEA